MIKAIIFDVGGVLMGAESKHKRKKEHGVFEHMAYKLGIKMDTWIDALDTSYAKSIEGKINGEEAVKIIANNLRVNKNKLEKLWIKAYKIHLKRNKKLYDIAYLLKRKGFRIGILSDQWHLSSKALVTKEDRKKFNPVIVSCEVGMRKPNPKIYRLLIKKLGLRAGEILFIDNRDWNTKPAEKLGIKTIVFKNNKQVLHEMKKMGVV